jgi:hypothetical protein
MCVKVAPNGTLCYIMQHSLDGWSTIYFRNNKLCAVALQIAKLATKGTQDYHLALGWETKKSPDYQNSGVPRLLFHCF